VTVVRRSRACRGTAGQRQAAVPRRCDIGDPIWPETTTVAVPRLRGGAPTELPGYPMHMVHAEETVTAIQRGIANTRWRDFGDI
jgi:hypothetical protein